MRMRVLERWLTIEDDRGARVPLVDPGDLKEGLTDFQRRELRLVVPQQPLRFVGLMLLFIASMAFVQMGLRLVSRGWPPVIAGWRQIAGTLAFWTLVFGLVALWHWRRKTRSVRRCLAWGVCASCGYPLRDALEGEDSLVVCPECGASWHSARVGARYPVE